MYGVPHTFFFVHCFLCATPLIAVHRVHLPSKYHLKTAKSLPTKMAVIYGRTDEQDEVQVYHDGSIEENLWTTLYSVVYRT